MKRIEMLEILKQILESECNEKFKQDSLDRILSAIERAGMEPPHISQDATQAAIHLYYGGFSYNQWDEDLLKDQKLQDEIKRREEWNKKSLEEKRAIRQAMREARHKKL